jgi:hypothetical protein
MPTVLFLVTGLDASDVDSEAQPPDREPGKPYRALGLANGTPLSVRILVGSPKSLKARSKKRRRRREAVRGPQARINPLGDAI